MIRTAFAVIGGIILGALLAWFGKDLLAQVSLPSDVKINLDRLTFYDVEKAVWMDQRIIYKHDREEPDWEMWQVGQGPAGYPADQIKLTVGRKIGDNTLSISINKKAWDAVDVYLDGVKKVTMPTYATLQTLYNGYYGIEYGMT